jgi:broad specificity phosphatase PhoE
MMTERRLLLTRHGETPQARDSIVQGHSETHLTPKGEADSRLLGDYLARQYNIQTIITSDLSRAVSTAGLIAQKIPIPPLIMKTAALRELACGVFEGQPFSRLQEMRRRDPRGWEEAAPPGGESLAAMRQRVLAWYRDLVATVREETLIVTHKGPLALILAAIAPSLSAASTQIALSHSSLVSLELSREGAVISLEIVQNPAELTAKEQ